MKNCSRILTLFFVLIVATNVVAQEKSMTGFLKLFSNEFPVEYNMGWPDVNSRTTIKAHSDQKRELTNLGIRLPDGKLVHHDLDGYAYAYKQIDKTRYWLVYCNEHESNISFWLSCLDVKKQCFSQPYQLAFNFGDQGDIGYKFGTFLNDSTYQYTQVLKPALQAIDSVWGQDRILPDGSFFELTKTKK